MNFPETRDSDFYWKDFQARNNNELADILGNFVNRTLTFAMKNFGGAVPVLLPAAPEKRDAVCALIAEDLQLAFDAIGTDGDAERSTAYINAQNKYAMYFTPNEFLLIWRLFTAPHIIARCYEDFRFRDGVAETLNLARAANKFFNDSAPWKSAKAQPDRCAVTVNLSLQTLRSLAIVCEPILPFTAEKMWRMLGLRKTYKDTWQSAGTLQILDGHRIAGSGTSPSALIVLFEKYADDRIQTQIDKLKKLPLSE